MTELEDKYTAAKQCLKEKKMIEAASLLEAVIALDKQNVEAHEMLAGICYLTKDYDRAIELYRRVNALDPKNVGALVNVGAVCNKKKEYQEAVKVLRAALAKDRRCPEAYYNLGIAQRGLNQNAMAVSAYKEAIRLAPDLVEAYTNLGNVLIEMKNHSQAVIQFRKALEINPEFKKAKVGLSHAQELSHSDKSSISPFGRLVDMDEIERKSHEKVKQLHLNQQQRFEDRDIVHKLAKDSELQAIELLDQVKKELSPVLLELSRLASEEVHGRVWAEELAEFQIACRRFGLKLSKLSEIIDYLEAHEEDINKFAS